MPIPSVDFNKSIEKERLSYKAGGFGLNLYFAWFIGLIIIFCACMPLIDKHTHPTVLSNCITIIIIIWMLANQVLMNALVKVSGTDINNNRKKIIASFNEIYDNLEFKAGEQIIIRNVKYSNNAKYFTNKRGKVITILFDGNNVYLNITSLFRGDSPSPFNGWYNYLKCKHVARIFLLKQG